MPTWAAIAGLAAIGIGAAAGIALGIRAMRRPDKRDRIEAYECPNCLRKQIIITKGAGTPPDPGDLYCRNCRHHGLKRIQFPPIIAWTEEQTTYIELNDWEKPAC